jgi:hypothetical protein
MSTEIAGCGVQARIGQGYANQGHIKGVREITLSRSCAQTAILRKSTATGNRSPTQGYESVPVPHGAPGAGIGGGTRVQRTMVLLCIALGRACCMLYGKSLVRVISICKAVYCSLGGAPPANRQPPGVIPLVGWLHGKVYYCVLRKERA